jgi:hypothetical protein
VVLECVREAERRIAGNQFMWVKLFFLANAKINFMIFVIDWKIVNNNNNQT